jgi:hypothetical protein
VIERKANSDIGLLRVTLNTFPALGLGILPVLVTVAQEVFRRTLVAKPFSRSLVVVCVEMKRIRTASTSRKTEIVNLITF